jgi:hypothetical protein
MIAELSNRLPIAGFAMLRRIQSLYLLLLLFILPAVRFQADGRVPFLKDDQF